MIECRKCGVLIPASYHLNHLCDRCSIEVEFVRRRNREAIKRGLQADLTADQWQSTLSRFQGLCAYCQKRKWEVLEHFIPTILGGGTTVSNVVPSCNCCNRRKYNHHPDQVTSIPRKDMERVRVFLSGLKS